MFQFVIVSEVHHTFQMMLGVQPRYGYLSVQTYLAQDAVRSAAAAAYVVACVAAGFLKESGIADEFVYQDSQAVGIGYLKTALDTFQVLSLAETLVVGAE